MPPWTTIEADADVVCNLHQRLSDVYPVNSIDVVLVGIFHQVSGKCYFVRHMYPIKLPLPPLCDGWAGRMSSAVETDACSLVLLWRHGRSKAACNMPSWAGNCYKHRPLSCCAFIPRLSPKILLCAPRLRSCWRVCLPLWCTGSKGTSGCLETLCGCRCDGVGW